MASHGSTTRKLFALYLSINTEHEVGKAASTDFKSSVWPDPESKPAYQLLVVRAQPTVTRFYQNIEFS